MPNNRIFYACQAVAFEPLYDSGGVLAPTGGVQVLHGVQSVGLNTTFNLEQVFELGQIHIYENIEGVPDVEVTLEKVLDGYPLMYHMATRGVGMETLSAASKASLVARSKQRTNVYLGIFPETIENIGDADTSADVEVQMSGMYVGSISYTLPVDGNCTESLTLVGNHKAWTISGTKFTSGVADQLDDTTTAGSGVDAPKNLQTDSFRGGIQRRENVDMKNSTLPISIYGVTQTVTSGNNYNNVSKSPRAHIQNCSISTDLNRESVQELGRKSPYYRFANFPVEVTCEFEVIAVSGDFINAYEEGAYAVGTKDYGNNTAEETIIMKLHDGTVFDLGTKNRLSSVNYTGGDAGGGNSTITYSYSTYNALTVFQPSDPVSGILPAGGFKYNGA
jgi:hypothetical protein